MATTTVAPKTKLTGGSFLLEDHNLENVFTPEDFNEDQLMIVKLADEFAVNELLPNVEKIEHKDWQLTHDLLKKAAEMGLTNADVPAEYGGSDMDKISSAIIADQMAKCGSFVVSMGAHAGIGTLPLVFFGTEEQKKKYLPKLAAGEMIGAYALSESTSGSDALNSRTRAVLSPDGKHYVLNGEKMWITNAHFADLFTILAKIDGEKFTAFLVEKDFPGFSVGNEEKKMGIRGSSTAPLILNDCKVPVENVLGDIGKGHIIAFNILNVGRFKLGASCVGGGRTSLRHAIAYAKERKAFGKTIADFGLIREKLAQMADQSEVGDGLAEGLALFGVGDGMSQRRAPAADATRAQLEAAHVQNVEGDDVPLADVAQHVLHRHLAVVEDEWRGRGAANAHLLLLVADRETGEVLLHQESGKLFAVDLGEDGEQVGEVGVGDPHLFAVQHVVLAVRGEHGAGAAVQRVGAAGAFRQRVRADDFGGRESRQIFLLLSFGAEEDDGQGADAAVRAHAHHEAAGPGHVVGDDGRGNLVHVGAAVLGGHVGVGQAHPGRFLQQLARHRPVLVLHLLGIGQDLVGGELVRQFRNHLLIFVEVFGSEDVIQVVIFEQKTSARGFCLGSCRYGGCHVQTSLFAVRFSVNVWNCHHERSEGSVLLSLVGKQVPRAKNGRS